MYVSGLFGAKHYICLFPIYLLIVNRCKEHITIYNFYLPPSTTVFIFILMIQSYVCIKFYNFALQLSSALH